MDLLSIVKNTGSVDITKRLDAKSDESAVAREYASYAATKNVKSIPGSVNPGTVSRYTEYVSENKVMKGPIPGENFSANYSEYAARHNGAISVLGDENANDGMTGTEKHIQPDEASLRGERRSVDPADRNGQLENEQEELQQRKAIVYGAETAEDDRAQHKDEIINYDSPNYKSGYGESYKGDYEEFYQNKRSQDIKADDPRQKLRSISQPTPEVIDREDLPDYPYTDSYKEYREDLYDNEHPSTPESDPGTLRRVSRGRTHVTKRHDPEKINHEYDSERVNYSEEYKEEYSSYRDEHSDLKEAKPRNEDGSADNPAINESIHNGPQKASSDRIATGSSSRDVKYYEQWGLAIKREAEQWLDKQKAEIDKLDVKADSYADGVLRTKRKTAINLNPTMAGMYIPNPLMLADQVPYGQAVASGAKKIMTALNAGTSLNIINSSTPYVMLPYAQIAFKNETFNKLWNRWSGVASGDVAGNLLDAVADTVAEHISIQDQPEKFVPAPSHQFDKAQQLQRIKALAKAYKTDKFDSSVFVPMYDKKYLTYIDLRMAIKRIPQSPKEQQFGSKTAGKIKVDAERLSDIRSEEEYKIERMFGIAAPFTDYDVYNHSKLEPKKSEQNAVDGNERPSNSTDNFENSYYRKLRETHSLQLLDPKKRGTFKKTGEVQPFFHIDVLDKVNVRVDRYIDFQIIAPPHLREVSSTYAMKHNVTATKYTVQGLGKSVDGSYNSYSEAVNAVRKAYIGGVDNKDIKLSGDALNEANRIRNNLYNGTDEEKLEAKSKLAKEMKSSPYFQDALLAGGYISGDDLEALYGDDNSEVAAEIRGDWESSIKSSDKDSMAKFQKAADYYANRTVFEKHAETYYNKHITNPGDESVTIKNNSTSAPLPEFKGRGTFDKDLSYLSTIDDFGGIINIDNASISERFGLYGECPTALQISFPRSIRISTVETDEFDVREWMKDYLRYYYYLDIAGNTSFKNDTGSNAQQSDPITDIDPFHHRPIFESYYILKIWLDRNEKGKEPFEHKNDYEVYYLYVVPNIDLSFKSRDARVYDIEWSIIGRSDAVNGYNDLTGDVQSKYPTVNKGVDEYINYSTKELNQSALQKQLAEEGRQKVIEEAKAIASNDSGVDDGWSGEAQGTVEEVFNTDGSN